MSSKPVNSFSCLIPTIVRVWDSLFSSRSVHLGVARYDVEGKKNVGVDLGLKTKLGWSSQHRKTRIIKVKQKLQSIHDDNEAHLSTRR